DRSMTSRLASFLAVVVTLLAVGCNRGGPTAPAPTATSPAAGAGSAATASVLGDLSAYRKIAVDTLEIVKKGDMAAAKARIKDLESAWDDAEETMKPRSPEKWTSVDKSIDRALASLRSGTPVQLVCSNDLETLLAKIDSIDKR